MNAPNPNDPFLPVLTAVRDILADHHESNAKLLEEIRDELRALRQAVDAEQE